MTARPHHLRLVVANDDLVRAASPVRLAWPAAAGAPAVVDTVRATLLQDAARTVLPPAPPALAASRAGLASAVPCEADPRGLWLGTAHLGLLEDLALVRRGRSFAVRGGPPQALLVSSPTSGAAHVRRLVRGDAAEFGPGPRDPDRGARRSPARSSALPRARAFAWLTLMVGLAALVRRKLSFF